MSFRRAISSATSVTSAGSFRFRGKGGELGKEHRFQSINDPMKCPLLLLLRHFCIFEGDGTAKGNEEVHINALFRSLDAAAIAVHDAARYPSFLFPQNSDHIACCVPIMDDDGKIDFWASRICLFGTIPVGHPSVVPNNSRPGFPDANDFRVRSKRFDPFQISSRCNQWRPQDASRQQRK